MNTKICKKCGEEKDALQFYRDKTRKDGLFPYCKPCNGISIKKYVAENKEKVSEYQSSYRVRNKDQTRQYQSSYYTKNREGLRTSQADYRSRNQDALRAASARWYLGNREKVNAHVAKRYATKVRATPAWADLDAIEDFYIIAAMFRLYTGQTYHVDHIVPIQGPIARSGPFKGERLVCGLHCEANLQVLPDAENLSKNNRWWPDMP